MSKYSLNEVIWEKFLIEDLFEVKGTKTTKLKELKNNNENGKREYPYITTKSTDNGVEGFYNYYTEEGNVITLDSATKGSTFYQKTNFSASDHVEKLVPKFKLNIYIALFICTSIKKACEDKFNYGYKLNQNRIKKQCIFLPINSENQPDFDFMQNYILENYENIINKYYKYILERYIN